MKHFYDELTDKVSTAFRLKNISTLKKIKREVYEKFNTNLINSEQYEAVNLFIETVIKTTTCDFSKALESLKDGKKIKRLGWNGNDQYVILGFMQECITSSGVSITEPVHNDIGSKFLMFVGTRGYQCGWVPSQADILADDWVVLPDHPEIPQNTP